MVRFQNIFKLSTILDPLKCFQPSIVPLEVTAPTYSKISYLDWWSGTILSGTILGGKYSRRVGIFLKVKKKNKDDSKKKMMKFTNSTWAINFFIITTITKRMTNIVAPTITST